MSYSSDVPLDGDEKLKKHRNYISQYLCVILRFAKINCIIVSVYEDVFLCLKFKMRLHFFQYIVD